MRLKTVAVSANIMLVVFFKTNWSSLWTINLPPVGDIRRFFTGYSGRILPSLNVGSWQVHKKEIWMMKWNEKGIQQCLNWSMYTLNVDVHSTSTKDVSFFWMFVKIFFKCLSYDLYRYRLTYSLFLAEHITNSQCHSFRQERRTAEQADFASVPVWRNAPRSSPEVKWNAESSQAWN